jgi:hypothetical protein
MDISPSLPKRRGQVLSCTEGMPMAENWLLELILYDICTITHKNNNRTTMNETIFIAILLVVTLFLYSSAKKQRKKAHQMRRKIVDKAWRRDEID